MVVRRQFDSRRVLLQRAAVTFWTLLRKKSGPTIFRGRGLFGGARKGSLSVAAQLLNVPGHVLPLLQQVRRAGRAVGSGRA